MVLGGGSENSDSVKEFINQLCYYRIVMGSTPVVKVDAMSCAPLQRGNATSLPAALPKLQDAAGPQQSGYRRLHTVNMAIKSQLHYGPPRRVYV
jgi:hypothetical protein